MSQTEIIFEVTEEEVGGGFAASALGYGIHTQGDSLEELRGNVKEAVLATLTISLPGPGSSGCISYARRFSPHEVAPGRGRNWQIGSVPLTQSHRRRTSALI